MVTHLAHLVEVLEFCRVESCLIALMATEETEGQFIGRLLPQQSQELVNLLVVCHVVLGKHALNLLKVPVGDSWDFFDLIDWPADMSILTVRSIDTKTISVVITFPTLNALPHFVTIIKVATFLIWFSCSAVRL